ncbi:MAG: Holliday junction resolvase RuvX [Halobacteriovoraceae bacterium]|nr:Holliday junction resolvase RuvX [Halobacteriovoraceae bacterium]MCB9095635.1 Holliday junction resolvase RuvX [Halobacteriovoraceae bacterium]
MNSHILCLDFGEKFIGLASYAKGKDPFPVLYDRIKFTNENAVFDQILSFIGAEEFTDIVVGIPYLLDRRETKMTKKVKSFAEKLRKILDKNGRESIPIHEQDEYLTTYQAKEYMRNSPLYNFKVDLSKIDTISAKIILQDFLATQSSIA